MLARLPERLNEEIGYLLGLIASDGYLGGQRRIGFINTDRDLHALFAAILERQFGVRARCRLNGAATKNLRLTGTGSESVFQPCYASYADNLLLARILGRIQDRLLTLPAPFLRAWLRGYFDGDGFI
ncbi:MAG: hypothetical protein C4321_05225, partial [Chloroflexota bacterium]